MIDKICAVFLAAAFLPGVAFAQTPLLTTSPPNPSNWDLAFHIGWLGGNKPLPSPNRNEWHDSASFDAVAGYYWTPNLKFDIGIGSSSESRVYVYQPVEIAGLSYPPFRGREHRIRTTTAAIGAAYQAFENAWFHPFFGGGLMVVHQTERANMSEPWIYYRGPQDRIVLPPLPPLSESVTSVRPFATAGFKAYVSERVFFRTDLRAAASSRGTESVEWRAGFGFDF